METAWRWVSTLCFFFFSGDDYKTPRTLAARGEWAMGEEDKSRRKGNGHGPKWENKCEQAFSIFPLGHWRAAARTWTVGPRWEASARHLEWGDGVSFSWLAATQAVGHRRTDRSAGKSRGRCPPNYGYSKTRGGPSLPPRALSRAPPQTRDHCDGLSNHR